MADPLRQCRDILEEIHSKRLPIAGGSGKRPRYEMRDTALYFKLGKALLTIVEGKDDQTALILLGRVMGKLQQEFDDSENVFRWSVRFVQAFQEESHFEEVSRICHYSFGQLREVTDILHRQNPLHISKQDLEDFTAKMQEPVTYEDVRKLCMDLKSKYLGQVPSLDTVEVRDIFDSVQRQAIELLEEGGESKRQQWREKAGIEGMASIRYVLMLLSREEVLENVKKNKPGILKSLNSGIRISDEDLDSLYHSLLEFLKSGRNARDHIRKVITPLEMGYLQTMMKALMTENDYISFTKTKNLFSEISL